MKKKLSQATKRKISLAQRGRKNSMYGRNHKPSTLARLSRGARGKNNPMHGRHHTAQTRRKISLARRRQTGK